MRANDNIHASTAQAVDSALALLGGCKARQERRLHRESLKPAQDRLIVLEGQDSSRNENCTLFTIRDALKGRAQGDLRLTEAHVPAEQAVHGVRPLHILLNLIDAPQLIVGLVVLKARLKIALHIRIRGEGVARRTHPFGVQGGELLGHILYSCPYTASGLGPVRAAKAVKFDGFGPAVLARGDIFGHQIELCDRHIEDIIL